MSNITKLNEVNIAKSPISFYSPKKESVDRFIPKRNNSLTNEIFNLPEKVLASPSDVSDFNEKEQNLYVLHDLCTAFCLSFGFDRQFFPQEYASIIC